MIRSCRRAAARRSSRRDIGRFGNLDQAKQLSVERAGFAFLAFGHSDLEMIEAGDLHGCACINAPLGQAVR